MYLRYDTKRAATGRRRDHLHVHVWMRLRDHRRVWRFSRSLFGHGQTVDGSGWNPIEFYEWRREKHRTRSIFCWCLFAWSGVEPFVFAITFSHKITRGFMSIGVSGNYSLMKGSAYDVSRFVFPMFSHSPTIPPSFTKSYKSTSFNEINPHYCLSSMANKSCRLHLSGRRLTLRYSTDGRVINGLSKIVRGTTGTVARWASILVRGSKAIIWRIVISLTPFHALGKIVAAPHVLLTPCYGHFRLDLIPKLCVHYFTKHLFRDLT